MTQIRTLRAVLAALVIAGSLTFAPQATARPGASHVKLDRRVHHLHTWISRALDRLEARVAVLEGSSATTADAEASGPTRSTARRRVTPRAIGRRLQRAERRAARRVARLETRIERVELQEHGAAQASPRATVRVGRIPTTPRWVRLRAGRLARQAQRVFGNFRPRVRELEQEAAHPSPGTEPDEPDDGEVTEESAHGEDAPEGQDQPSGGTTGGSTSGGGSSEPSPSPSPSQSPTTAGFLLEVGDNFQQIVDANPPGTRFVIASGVHRMQRVRPKDDMVFVGEQGAVMSGAKVLTSLAREGSLWVASGQTQQGFRHPCGYPGGCWLEGHERDNYPEELFIDGRRLRHVSSKSQVGPGRWFFDYGANKIYIGDDPAGKLVETSVADFAFFGNASGVVIDNLTVRHYANPPQRGAINALDGNNWTIRYVDTSYNHGAGVSLGPGSHLHNSKLAYNGQIGLKGRKGEGIVIEHNEIAHNLQLGYNPGWEGGAMKITSSIGTLFQNNWVHHNNGYGIWFDINNFDTVIRSNLSEHNEYNGIFYEISYGNTKIYWNTVRHNGEGKPGADGAGIRISNSREVEVYENAVDSNERGIMLTMVNRGSGADGLWETANVKIKDNDIRMRTGTTGLVDETGNDAYYHSKGNVFEGNTYRLEGTWRFSWVGRWWPAHNWTEWRGFGKDPSGFITDALSSPGLPSGATGFLEMPYGPE